LIVIDLRRVRKWIVVAVCLALGVLLLAIGYNSLETGVFTPGEDIRYKDYSGLDGRFSYKLPENWRTARESFGGREIIYHNGFSSPDGKITGYVQVWDLNIPLAEFIAEGRKSAVDIVSFKYYTVEPVKINGREGYVLQYSRGKDNKYIKGFEVFLIDGGNRFCRFAFYMDETAWKDEYRMFFFNIAASAEFK
jgi:hypothetical protein